MFIQLKTFLNNHDYKFTLIIGPKTKGQIYWKVRDICRVMRVAKTSQLTRGFSGDTKCFSNITERYKFSKTRVLSTQDIYKLFDHLPPKMRNRDFETWFRNATTGKINLMATNRSLFYRCLESITESFNETSKNTETSYKYNSFINEVRPIYVNEYIHYPELLIDKYGVQQETEDSKAMLKHVFTLPDLIKVIKLIPDKEKGNKNDAVFTKFYEYSSPILKNTLENGSTSSLAELFPLHTVFLRLKVPLYADVWITGISSPQTHGNLYWKAKGVCFEMSGKLSTIIRHHFGVDTPIMRYSDITNTTSQTIVFSSKQVLKLYEYINDLDEINFFENIIEWFEGIHTGEYKLIPYNRKVFFNCLNTVLGLNTHSKRRQKTLKVDDKTLYMRTFDPIQDFAEADNVFTLQQLMEVLCPTLKKFNVKDQVASSPLENSFEDIVSMMKDNGYHTTNIPQLNFSS